MTESAVSLEGELRAFGVQVRATPAEILSSAVTTAWGVQWTESMIARDLLQNFVDANRQTLNKVLVRSSRAGVTVTAPTEFELARLFFLGSEKDEGDVGQYGEGFKAAAICLLRDHDVQPVVLSGTRAVRLRVADEQVAGTALRPVIYEFFNLTPGIDGTALLLGTRQPKLVRALCEGMVDFLHPENPLLGPCVHQAEGLALHHSTDGNGHLFYRHLRRCTIAGYPLVWVVTDPLTLVERRIAKDRDRNAFGDTVRDLYLKGFIQRLYRARWDMPIPATLALLEAGRAHWEHGHPVLSLLSDPIRGSRYDSLRLSISKVFGEGYYAHSLLAHRDPARQLEVDSVEKAWKAAGRLATPGYFKHFGLISAEAHLDAVAARARSAARESDCRPPSPAETEGLALLRKLMKEFAPELYTLLGQHSYQYTVGRNSELLGELRRDRGYRSKEVYFDAEIFVSDLPCAAAIFLHEHAHVFGYDGSRGFTDALTELLETVIRHRNQLEKFDRAWSGQVEKVQLERRLKTPAIDEQSLAALIEGLDAEALRKIVMRLPAVAVRAVLPQIADPV